MPVECFNLENENEKYDAIIFMDLRFRSNIRHRGS